MTFNSNFSRAIIFTFFLLFSATSSLGMGQNLNPSDNNDNTKPPFTRPSLVNVEEGYGESIQDMESCYLNAPSVAKQIVALLQDPTHFVKTYRFALIVSGPGDGKTLLSKAIAYKAGWKCKFFPACSFAGTARTETLKNMLYALHWIVESNEETVINIDEINRLADNAENTNYDTKETATAIWNFIDEHKYNPKIYLIGTMNDATKIPKPLKQRAQGRIIRPQPLSLDAKRKMLKDKIQEARWDVNEAECTDVFLDGILQAIPDLNARDVESLAYVAVAQAMESNNYQPIGNIEQRHFQGALEQVHLDRQTMNYNREEESREEREDRLRKKDQKLNKKQNKKNRKQTKKLHKDQAKRQEKHQIQSLLTTVEMGTNQLNANVFGIGVSNIGLKGQTINKLLTREQLRLITQPYTDARLVAEKQANDALAKLNPKLRREERLVFAKNVNNALEVEARAIRAEQEALAVEADRLDPLEPCSAWIALKNYGQALIERRRAECLAYRAAWIKENTNESSK